MTGEAGRRRYKSTRDGVQFSERQVYNGYSRAGQAKFGLSCGKSTKGRESKRGSGGLDFVFLGVVAERAIGHLEEFGGAGADTAGAFESGEKIRALHVADVLF